MNSAHENKRPLRLGSVPAADAGGGGDRSGLGLDDRRLRSKGWEQPAAQAEAPVVALPSGDEAPTIELVPCSGHHGSDDQPQQALFSWAEFLAEQPEQPEPRGRNPRPSGHSLFDWALEREQETGLVAAGG